MNGAALIVDNVEDLTMNIFDAGRQETSKDNKGVSIWAKSTFNYYTHFHFCQFTSLYFRNVTFSNVANVLTFEMKQEIRFQKVKVKGDVFNVEVMNRFNYLDPIFILEDSVFEGVENVKQGLGPVSERFILKVTIRWLSFVKTF